MAAPKKLKVFRTPIGFHDAYVAAPSQKAALEAWGSDANLFARGAAEQVTDPNLMKAALARPGEVIKVLRGDEAAQIRALGKAPAKSKAKTADGEPAARSGATKTKPAKPKKRPPRPSRAGLEKAERALEQAEARQAKAMEALRQAERALAAKRREVEGKLREERRALEGAVDEAREAYALAMEEWAAE